MLLERAREMLADPVQGSFDLGIEPVAPRARLVTREAAPALFDAGSPGETPAAAGPARMVTTDSRLLFEVLAGVFGDLGFDVLGDEVFRDLVIARVVEPTSIAGHRPGPGGAGPGQGEPVDKTHAPDAAPLRGRGYRDQIAELCFTHALASGDVSLVLYDVTTLYFEAENEDALRKVGYSKERRVDPQIVVGLLVDRHGLPARDRLLRGEQGREAHDPAGHQAVPRPARHRGHGRGRRRRDALGREPGRRSTTPGCRFIVGSRVTKAPIDLESHFRWHGDAFGDGQVIDTLTPKTGQNNDNDPALRAEPVWDPEDAPDVVAGGVGLLRANAPSATTKTLTAQENRARDVITGGKTARTPRFVKTAKGGSGSTRPRSPARRRLVGLKGYVTNIPATVMPAAEVIASYHDLWHVEQSFRMSKTDLAARPMFARTRDAIEAHLTIVFTALAVSRKVQNRTGLAIRHVLRTLRPLRSATIEINGTVQTFPPAIHPEQQKILDDLKNGRDLRH